MILKFKDFIQLAERSNSFQDMEKLKDSYSLKDIEEALCIRPIPDEVVDIYLTLGSLNLVEEYANLSLGWRLVDIYDIDAVIDLKNSTTDYFIEENFDGNKEEYQKYLNENSILDWKPDMVPFLENGSGDFICFRNLPKDRSIWVICHDDSSHKLNTNIELFYKTRIELYNRDAYSFHYNVEDKSEVEFDHDWELSEEILKEIDPTIEYYHAI